MSKPDHTPGPWVKSRNHAVVTKSNGYKIRQDRPAGAAAVCGVWDSLEDQLQADARLIAAAPELLEALEITERWMLGGMPSPYSDQVVLEKVQRAIAKAKGENQ